MAIFGAVPNNAPILSKAKPADVTYKGKTDKKGISIYHVGTVAAKHHLYSRLSRDADKQADERMVHMSEDLPPEYFRGIVSEIYNPIKNRFEPRGGARNEPLDTWVYAYAAAHHQELRLHRRTKADWDAAAERLQHSRPQQAIPAVAQPAPASANAASAAESSAVPRGTPARTSSAQPFRGFGGRS